jgi:hypothetical protein
MPPRAGAPAYRSYQDGLTGVAITAEATDDWAPVLPLVCALLPILFASPAPDEARTRAQKILKDGYQASLPTSEAGSGTGERSPKNDLRPATPRRRDRGRMEAGGTGAFGSIAQLLLWVIMGVVLVLGAIWLVGEMGAFTGDAAATPAEREAGPDAPDRAVVERPLGDADELARRGHFGEAIHVLLLRTLQELARRLPERLPASLTSREILARVRIPDDARGALAALVGAVEVSHFGGMAPDQSDFAHCRQHFQRFAEAYLRGGMQAPT